MKIATSDSWSSLRRLGSLLQRIEAGKSPLTLDRPARFGEYGVLKVSAVSWGEFRPKENKAIPADFDITGVPTVNAGDLIISRANTTELVGAAIVASQDYPQLLLSDKTLKLVPNKELVWPKYLLYALRSQDVRRHIEAHATGTSDSMRNISQANLCAAEIPIPALPDQKRIAAILDKADAIRRMRRESVRVAEKIIQCLYLDNFGHASPNCGSWPILNLEKIAAPRAGSMRTGPFGSDLKHSEFTGIGIPVLGIDNVVTNSFSWAQRRYISQQKYESLKRYQVFPGDVLVTIMGTIGRSAIVPDDIETAITTKHLAAISVNRDIIHPEYLSNTIHRHPDVIRQIDSACRGAIMNGLNLGIIKKLSIRLPPLSAQEKFITHLRSLRIAHGQVSQALLQAEALFDSLLHRAFRGELTSPESAPRQLSIFTTESKHS